MLSLEWRFHNDRGIVLLSISLVYLLILTAILNIDIIRVYDNTEKGLKCRKKKKGNNVRFTKMRNVK